MILQVIKYESDIVGNLVFQVAANCSTGSRALVVRDRTDGNFTCTDNPCVYYGRQTHCEHVAVAEHFYNEEIYGKVCGAQNGTFSCSLLVGHTGDHRQNDPSGGCIGWRNESKPIARRYNIEEVAEDQPLFGSKKRRIVVAD